jgi:DNA polymerase-1
MKGDMQILAGEAAMAALERLAAAAPLLAVACDPAARCGTPVQALALAHKDGAIVIDAAGTPQLSAFLQEDRPFAAHDAKVVHRALLRRYGQGPARWACVRITELLLLGGRDAALELDAIADRHEIAALPPVEAGIAAMATHAQLLAQLVARQGDRIKRASLTTVSRLEAAAVAPIGEMEHRGMPFDAPAWRQLTNADSAERRALTRTLAQALGPRGGRDLFGGSTLNLDSDADLLAALRALGHDVRNVRRRTLATLPAPLGPALARYRALSKLTSAYGLSFLDNVGPDGRLHPTFEQIGASTGRMACAAPNLQAITKDSGRRACFHTSPDRRLVVADYAACELRILAEMSGDPVFLEAFARHEDVHARVAQSIFGKPVSKDENPQLRQIAKGVNFGLAYGMGAAGLARTVQIEERAARDLLQRHFKTFPRIRGFLQDAAATAMARGWAQTLAGRRLYLDPPAADGARAQAERIAKNMPIQGTNADITKIALARLRRALAPFPDTWVVNCVHDEVVVECPAHAAEAVAPVVASEMTAAGAELLRTVRLAVDVEITDAWAK